MVTLLWIVFSLLLNAGRSERHHVRHERTRYMTVGADRFDDGHESSAGRNWDDGNRVQVPGDPSYSSRMSRPLFSWDRPGHQLPAVARMNYPGNISATKPTVWHEQMKRKPFLKRVQPSNSVVEPRSRHAKKDSIAFRNSYVYKSAPTEEVKPKKIIRIVYGDSRKGKTKDRIPVYDGEGRRRCDNPGGCKYRKKYKSPSSNDVVYFPKGMTHYGRRHKPKSAKSKGKESSTERPLSGACTIAQEKCEQICTERDGKAICSCYGGFHLVNGTKCVDVDECLRNNGGCEGICVNTVGSRRCLCPEGYRLSSTNGKCDDINECLLRNGHGPCQDVCINTRGSYYCTCDGLKGTVLSADKHACEEVDDCSSGLAGCSHTCISTFGRSFCTCPDGYELGDDWKTCHDVDECSDPYNYDVNCEYGCINTQGSYRCEARPMKGR